MKKPLSDAKLCICVAIISCNYKQPSTNFNERKEQTMKNKTAVATRKVTRTVEVKQLSVTCVNIDTKTIETLAVEIPNVKYRTNTALEKAIQNAISAKGNYKYVDHAEVGTLYILYSMPESEYLAQATIVATGTDKDNMEKIEKEESEEVEA